MIINRYWAIGLRLPDVIRFQRIYRYPPQKRPLPDSLTFFWFSFLFPNKQSNRVQKKK